MRAITGWLCSLCSLGIAGAASLAQAQAVAKEFPTRPVRIVVGFSAGSSTDFTARTIGAKLADLWKQPSLARGTMLRLNSSVFTHSASQAV